QALFVRRWSALGPVPSLPEWKRPFSSSFRVLVIYHDGAGRLLRWLPRLHFVRRWPGYAAKFATRPLAHKRPEGRGCHGWIFGPGAAAERNIQSGVAPKEETNRQSIGLTWLVILN